MIKMPLEQIIQRITESKGISEDEVKEKIDQKLKQLSGLISKEGAAHIIANELGVKLFETSGKMQIKSVCAGMRNVDVLGKVVEKYEVRQFESSRGPGKVGSILLGDETGIIRVVFWNDQADKLENINKDDTLKLQSGYVRENNNRIEIQLNDRSKVMVNPPGEKVESVKSRQAASSRKSINELDEQDQNVEILGTVVQVFDPRFFEVCPECGKRARSKDDGFYCDTHQKVEPNYSYVLNAFLDDGTENIRAVFFRNQAERLCGLSQDEFLKIKDTPSTFETVKTELLGNIVKLIGRVTKNQMFDRFEFIVNQVYSEVDPKEELKMMNSESDSNAQTQPVQESSTDESDSASSSEETAFSQASTQSHTTSSARDTKPLADQEEPVEEVVNEINESSLEVSENKDPLKGNPKEPNPDLE